MNKTTVPVVVSRFIDASPQRVYDAWLIPQNAAKWLFATPTGPMVAHMGRFIELVPGRRIVFTFKAPEYSSEETIVRVEIAPKGKGTKVVLTHEDALPEESAPIMDGWTKILDGLAKGTTAS